MTKLQHKASCKPLYSARDNSPCVRRISLLPGDLKAALDWPCLAKTTSERSVGGWMKQKVIQHLPECGLKHWYDSLKVTCLIKWTHAFVRFTFTHQHHSPRCPFSHMQHRNIISRLFKMVLVGAHMMQDMMQKLHCLKVGVNFNATPRIMGAVPCND